MKLTAKIASHIHGMLLHYKFDKSRWAYKVSLSEWDGLASEMFSQKFNHSLMTGTPLPSGLVTRLEILGVEIVKDPGLSTGPVLKDYGSSG